MKPTLEDLYNKFTTNSFDTKTEHKIFEVIDIALNERFVYKYQSSAYGIKNFIENVIYYNDPRNFNDKRDCSLNLISLDEKFLDDLILEEFNKPIYSKYSRNIIKEKLKDKKLKYKLFEQFKPEAINKIISNIGVSSFTNTPFEELMWGHYTSNSTGICIEYNLLELILFFNKVEQKATFFKVEYRPELKPIRFNKENIFDKSIEWVSVKKDNWRYENEVRSFIHSNNLSRTVTIPPSTITAIYLGINISDDNRQKIINHIKNNALSTKVHQMKFGEALNLCSVHLEF